MPRRRASQRSKAASRRNIRKAQVSRVRLRQPRSFRRSQAGIARRTFRTR